MKNIRNSLLALLVIVVALSCTTIPNNGVQKKNPSETDYGSYPSNFEEIVKEYYDRVLFDPYSAHYKVLGEPFRGYYVPPTLFLDYKEYVGYVVPVRINAKNRYGAYVGAEEKGLIIRNNEVIYTVPLSYFGNIQLRPITDTTLVPIDDISPNDNSKVNLVSDKYVLVKFDKISAYSGPGFKNNIILDLTKGTKLEIIAETDFWYKIRLNYNEEGWVSKQWVE